MKKLVSISLLFILVLLVNSSAIAQVKSSAAQTVMFTVNRSAKPVLDAFRNDLKTTLLSYSSETSTFKNVWEKTSIKVTLFETSSHTTVSKNTANIHTDVRFVSHVKNSLLKDTDQLILTITE